MSLFNRAIKFVKRRRKNIIEGNFNCIPIPFNRFRKIFPGIEQKKYYLVSANSKVGKSQITDYLFVYNAYKFCKENNIPLKIFYFSLEQDKLTKTLQAFCHLLYIEKGIRISLKQLRSTNLALDEDIIKEIEEFKEWFEGFEKSVIYIEDIKNPYGIYKYVRDYMKENGTVHFKEIKDAQGNVLKLFDYYEPNDPTSYTISIVDHYSLLLVEKGKDLSQSMRDMSHYNILLRNNYGVTPVGVQQQANAQEGIENIKLGKLLPSFNGLADCKDTQRDIDLAIGLFTPHRHEMKTYLGYDIEYFKDNIRFLNIMGGREGGFGEIAPLFFDGAVTFFKELPLSSNRKKLEIVHKIIKKIRC